MVNYHDGLKEVMTHNIELFGCSCGDDARRVWSVDAVTDGRGSGQTDTQHVVGATGCKPSSVWLAILTHRRAQLLVAGGRLG